MSALASQFDCILFDLDGVVYRGPAEIPGASQTIESLRSLGVASFYVTNNASRTPEQVSEHLRNLGINVAPEAVVTSAQAGAQVLRNFVPEGAHVYVIGGIGIDTALSEVGLIPRRDPTGCRAVLQGFGSDVNWQELAEASYLIQSGAVWVATNSDATFPTDRGIAPGNGSLVAAVANAVGREPDGIGGKPAPALLELAIARSASLKPLMVGDRYDTDIQGGVNLGIHTLLVLSGVASVTDIWRAEVQATFLGESLETLAEPYPNPEVRGLTALCGSAQAMYSPHQHQVVARGGSIINRIRAADALKWKLVPEVGLLPFVQGGISLDINHGDP